MSEESEKKKKEIIAARHAAIKESATNSFEELFKVVSKFHDLDKSMQVTLNDLEKLHKKIGSSSIESRFLGRRMRLENALKVLLLAKNNLRDVSSSLLRVHITQEQILDDLENLDVSI